MGLLVNGDFYFPQGFPAVEFIELLAMVFDGFNIIGGVLRAFWAE